MKTSEKILIFIHGYRQLHSKSPTQREIAEHVGRSISTVHEAISKLETEGQLTRKRNTSPNTGRGRTIDLPSKREAGSIDL